MCYLNGQYLKFSGMPVLIILWFLKNPLEKNYLKLDTVKIEKWSFMAIGHMKERNPENYWKNDSSVSV